MNYNTTRARVPVAPYVAANPGRPIRYVLADHGPTAFIVFKDGSTLTTPKAEVHE